MPGETLRLGPHDDPPTDKPGPSRGLCDSCRHQQLVPNTRGSVFSLCLKSRTDPSFPRYPRLPVAACPGHEPRDRGPDRAAP